MKRFWNFIVFVAACIALGVFTVGTVAGALAVLVGAARLVGTETAARLFVCTITLLFLFLLGFMVAELIDMVTDRDVFEIPPRIARRLREMFSRAKQKEDSDGKDKKPFPKEAEDAEIVG